MKITKQLILPLALLFMLACARGQDIHYNYDRGANFQSYRTYQWVDLRKGPGGPSNADVPAGLPNLPMGPPPMSGGNVPDDQLLDQDIHRAVDAQLAEKGLTKVDKGGDLLVGYQAHIREEKSINLLGSGANGFGAEVHTGGAASARFKARPLPFRLGRWWWACMTLQESS